MIDFQRLYPDVKAPYRATPFSVCFDIHAFIKTDGNRANNMLIPPGMTRAVPTGLRFRSPSGLLVCPRSGLSMKSVFVANSPGVIDADYRGEIKVLLFNGGIESYYVQHGDRIAQILVLDDIMGATFNEVPHIDPNETTRSDGGFGSTGR